MRTLQKKKNPGEKKTKKSLQEEIYHLRQRVAELEGLEEKRRIIEEALQESEKKYRAIFDNAREGMFQVSPDGRFISANPSLAKIHGYDSPEELIEEVTDIAHQLHVDPKRREKYIKILAEKGYVNNFEFRMYRKDGTTNWMSTNTRVVKDGKGRMLYYEGTVVDITERKKAEEAVRNERDRFLTLVENVPVGVIMISPQGGFTYINPKFTQMLGYDLSDVPDGRTWFRKAYPESEYRHRVISTWVNDLEEFKRTHKTGERKQYEFTVRCKDGSEKIVNFVPVRIATGEHIETLEDVTERRRAEESLKRSREELERLNRMKTKAVHHISHEMKTPLAVIQGNLRVARKKLEQGTALSYSSKFIDVILKHVGRLLKIQSEVDQIFRLSQELEAGSLAEEVDRLCQTPDNYVTMPENVRSDWNNVREWLYAFSRRGRELVHPFNLFELAKRVVERTRKLSSNRSVRIQLSGDENVFLSMDQKVIDDVAEGLLRNAIENTPDGGTVDITIEKKGSHVVLHVEDSGTGITEWNRGHIFDGLFHPRETDVYTSRKSYDFGAGGTGLHLLRMKMQGQRFGFKISLESERCPYLPTDMDICPGDAYQCHHCATLEDCTKTGGTVFSVAFPL